MMAQKHLRDLLCEDQEPFFLKNYIDERRSQLKRSVPRTHLQVKRQKPISQNATFPGSFCKNACFFSFHDSPDVRKSPLFDFSSPLKSPCRNSNTLFVHIPSRTAAVLLEAALRIQKQSKSKSPNKNLGFGFFGSVFKKITLRKRNRKPEIKWDETKVSVKDILRRDSSNEAKKFTEQRCENPETMEALDEKRVSEMGFSCSCNGRFSDSLSESDEDISEDLETSSSRSEDSEEVELVVDKRKNGDFDSCETAFCSSPFLFGLQKSPSLGRRGPELESSAISPSRHRKEVIEGEEEEGSSSYVGKECDQEDKEQCSPVSVLDPLFDDCDADDDDDDNGRQEDYEEEVEEHNFELEHSFAIVQKAKQQLLHKLRRFERLTDLNPIELEKRLSEEDDDNVVIDEIEECDDEDEPVSPNEEKSEDGFVREILSRFNLCNIRRIPGDMKRLVSDLIAEEAGPEGSSDDRELVLKKVCKRLESWKDVEFNTIDMMVDLDFTREGGKWRRYQEQLQETAVEIELAIFGFLVQELSNELLPL